MKNKYTVSVIGGSTSHGEFTFTVIFHDGCQKLYRVDQYAFMAARVSEREYIEWTILEHYSEFYNETPDLQINFY